MAAGPSTANFIFHWKRNKPSLSSPEWQLSESVYDQGLWGTPWSMS